jgi:hypothetical protein
VGARICSFCRLALNGQRDAGKQVLSEALSAPLQLSGYHYYISAEVCAQLGEVESAVEMLWRNRATNLMRALFQGKLSSNVRSSERMSVIVRSPFSFGRPKV